VIGVVRRARPRATAALVALIGSAIATAAARPAAAQTILEGEGIEPPHRYHSPRNFAFQLSFGPYRPNVDSEFKSGRHPYQDFFGSGGDLLSQIEFDYQVFHRMGTLAIGVGVGYFHTSGLAPLADRSGNLSGDQSNMAIVPASLSAVYRFDYFLEQNDFPLVPYAKLGLDYAYWQITDGNGEIAGDSLGGHGRGGTAGWHAAGGLALVLDMFDPDAARSFDGDLGVNHTALIIEYGHYDISGLGQSNRLHVGDTTWTLGLLFEF
jgi:hypothetical protein